MKAIFIIVYIFVVTGCMQSSREGSSVGPGREDGYGNAMLYLPRIAPSPLFKGSPLGTFQLEISSPDFVPIKHAWNLDSLKGYPVEVKRIPAGKARLFTGRLVEPFGKVTHEGSASVEIIAGQTAQVYLKLTLAGEGTGSAVICVEVEGFPPPPQCAKPIEDHDVKGCWDFSRDFGDPRTGKLEFLHARLGILLGAITSGQDTVYKITYVNLLKDQLIFSTVYQPIVPYFATIDPLGKTMSGTAGPHGGKVGNWKATRTECIRETSGP